MSLRVCYIVAVNAMMSTPQLMPQMWVHACKRLNEMKYAEDARKTAQQRRDRIAPAAQILNVSSALNDASSFASSRLNWIECERAENIIASEAEETREPNAISRNSSCEASRSWQSLKVLNATASIFPAIF